MHNWKCKFFGHKFKYKPWAYMGYDSVLKMPECRTDRKYVCKRCGTIVEYDIPKEVDDEYGVDIICPRCGDIRHIKQEVFKNIVEEYK